MSLSDDNNAVAVHNSLNLIVVPADAASLSLHLDEICVPENLKDITVESIRKRSRSIDCETIHDEHPKKYLKKNVTDAKEQNNIDDCSIVNSVSLDKNIGTNNLVKEENILSVGDIDNYNTEPTLTEDNDDLYLNNARLESFVL